MSSFMREFLVRVFTDLILFRSILGFKNYFKNFLYILTLYGGFTVRFNLS